MIVREVRLENVKSFGSPAEIIRLTRGVNAVSGPNGAGKSTILEAIGSALFQFLPYRQESFVREGESSGTITVVVDSRLDGRTYEVVRKVGRGATHNVYDPDILQFVARGEADVGRWLRLHLQVDPEVDLRSLFVDSIGPPQGTLTAAFLDSPQARKAKFNRLLRVDEYENAFRNLLTLESAIDADRTSVDRLIATLEAETRGRADLEARRIQRRDEQVSLARRLGDLTAEREELEGIIASFDAAELLVRAATAEREVAAERARHSADLLRLAQMDHATALRAAEAVERQRSARDRYLLAETALMDLETRRQARDRLRATANEWALKLSGLQGKLNSVNESIAEGERASDEIVELEQRIPLQDAADARLQSARMAKRSLDENRRQLAALHELVDRAATRLRRAEAAVLAAAEKRKLADELPDRQMIHRSSAANLATIDQANGTMKAVRENLPAIKRRAEALRARLTAIDEQIARLARPRAPVLSLQTLEVQHRKVIEDRAAAASHLKFAIDSRTQVKGGLCPLLNEPCKNLRPGITLEGHFDGEVDRWTARIARLGADFTEIDQKLLTTRKQVEDNARLEVLRTDSLEVSTELKETEGRLAEAEKELRDAAAIASARTVAERALQVASVALQEAQEAVQIVGRLPDLTRDVSEAQEDLKRRQAELASAQATVANASAIDAEVAAAAAERNAVGSPREAAAHRRSAVDRLPGLFNDQRRIGAQVEAASSRVLEATTELEQFADVDRLVDRERRTREETRASYEAYVAAEPAAEMLDARASALREADAASATATLEVQRANGAVAEANAAYDANAHRNSRLRRTEIGTALGETRARLTAATEEEARLDRELAAIRRRELKLAEESKHRDDIDSQRQLAVTMRSAIRSAGPEITRQLLGKISRTAALLNSEILNQSGIEVEWTADYDIVTRRQGETRGFAQLSGGEQMAAALAVRMAAMRHLSRIRFAFLDEPTAHLDEARRSNLGDQVQRLQGFDQLVVISHDDTFDGLFGHVVRIVREDGRSRVLDGA